MKRVNRGWIYYTRKEGMQDAFYVSSNATTGEVKGKFVGMGITGSEKAVAYFEEGLKLGPIKLEPYGPLGLRVYTEEEEVGDVFEVELKRPIYPGTDYNPPTVDEVVEDLHGLMNTGKEKVVFEYGTKRLMLEGLILRGKDDSEMVLCLVENQYPIPMPTPADRLAELADAISHLSESWANAGQADSDILDHHYPKDWPNFEEMVGDVIGWLNKVKGKE